MKMKLFEQQIVFKSWLIILKFSSDTGVLIFPLKEKIQIVLPTLKAIMKLSLAVTFS